MSGGWWLDIVALILLLISGILLWLIESERIGGEESDTVDQLADDASAQGRRRFPARLLRQAGFNPDGSTLLFWSVKPALGLLVCVLLLEQLRTPLWGALLGGVAGSFLPEIWLLLRRQRRRADISNALGYFIHLLVIYLRSGMNLAQAFNEAANTGLAASNPLRGEIALINQEIAAGRERDQAFGLLAERTGVKDLQRLAAVISIGYRAGSPITDTLQAQAELLRARQQQLVTQMISRRSMEAMLPMMLISFPVFVVLVLFPASVQVLDVLSMIGELF